MLQPLLDAFGSMPAPGRSAAVRAMTRLPLKRSAWLALSPHTNALLQELEENDGLHAGDFHTFEHVPLHSVQDHLRGLNLQQGVGRRPSAAGDLPARIASESTLLRSGGSLLARATAPGAGIFDRLARDAHGARSELSGAEREQIATLTGEDAAGLLVFALQRTAATQGHSRVWATHALCRLAAAMPGRLQLPVEQLLSDPRVAGDLPREVLAWTLARADLQGTVEAIVQASIRSSLEQSTAWMYWLEDIASQAHAPTPRPHAEALEALTTPDREVIDDSPQRKAPRTGSAAPPQAAESAQVQLAPSVTRVFPDIVASDEHPVRGTPLHVEVFLAASPAAGVAGQVDLPAADPAHVFDLRVHLLAGDFSGWDSLQYSHAQGVIKPAAFDLAAPSPEGERSLFGLRANFYLDGRWTGEAARNLDLRRDKDVARLDAIPPLPAAGGEDFASLHLQPGATPPDLLVRIQRGSSLGAYVWTCQSPHLPLTTDPTPTEKDCLMLLGTDAETYVRNVFKPLAGQPLQGLAFAEVEGAGEQLYLSTPNILKQAYWRLWEAAAQGEFRFESIQIVTDEPYVPWELMRVADDRFPDVEPEFLGVRHCVGRWLASDSAKLVQRLRVSTLAVSASSYTEVASVTQKLDWAGAERTLLVDKYHARNIPLRSTALYDYLQRTDGDQALHLACHGRMSTTAPNTSELILEDNPQNLRPTVIARTEVRRGFGSQDPLVFLNACEVGGAAASLSLVAGFPAAFLHAGAAAVVCPLWAVNDQRALKIAETFYTDVMKAPGRSLGAVLRDIRAQWRDGAHLTYLAYVLYGDPLATVDYQP